MLKKSKEKYEDLLIDTALEYNELYKFISGSGVYRITAPDGMNGPITYSCMDVMDTIYRKYNKTKDKNIPLLTEEAFYKIFEIFKSERIVNALKALDYHMYCEKNGEAPFKINCQIALEKARENLVRNKNLFQSEQYGFWEDLEDMDKNISNEHGIHII